MGTGGAGVKALIQLANFTLSPDATLNTEIHKNSVRIKAPNSVNASKRKHKNQINHYDKQRRVHMATVCQSRSKPVVEPRRAKPKTYRQAPTHWLKFYEEAVIESEARTAVVQLKSKSVLNLVYIPIGPHNFQLFPNGSHCFSIRHE